MGLLIGILLGLACGLLANKVVARSGESLTMDIVLGLTGALVGAFIIGQMPALAGRPGAEGGPGAGLPGLITALLGAILVLAVYHGLFRPRA